MSSNEEQPSKLLRLGKCEVCLNQNAKYTCPKCEVKTCCLRCLNIHKVELNCNGVRDKTKFVPLRQMTNKDFMGDYCFLEECTNFLENRNRDKLKSQTQYNKALPTSLYRLRNAALKRKTKLKFLLNLFTRHKENSTYYDYNNDLIYWRVEWVFINAEKLKFVDEHVSEDDKVSDLLEKYLNLNNFQEYNPHLQFYQSKGLGKIQILLKSEGIKNCQKRFYNIDCRKTIKENLSSKTIVEFPCFHVIYDVQPGGLDIIQSDDDVETETKHHTEKFEKAFRQHVFEIQQTSAQVIEKNRNIIFEKNKLIKEKQKRSKPNTLDSSTKNYLFSNEKLWNELLTDSDDNDTGEENL